MKKLSGEEYLSAARYIDRQSCGVVYPLSIAERKQPGEIFAGPRSVLLWHMCGFAFVYGECDEAFLGEIYDAFFRADIAEKRRFALFAPDERIRRFFAGRENVKMSRRYFFEYPHSCSDRYSDNCRVSRRALPEGFVIREMDERLLDSISGRITPFFSWDSKSEFLRKGKGFCVTDGDIPAAWAFTAAVGGEEADIGVETAESYRRKGLAAAAVRELSGYLIGCSKRPVWACSADNAASRALAESTGFLRTAECPIFTRE